VLKTSISCGVRRLNFSLMPFFILSNDLRMLFACLKSVFCVCWCVCLCVCLFVGTPSFPVEIILFWVYGACIE